jgi:hypothetical protein
MNKNFHLLLLLAALFSVNLASTQASERLPSPFIILPQPQEVVLLKGSGLEHGKLLNIVLQGGFKRPVMGNILSQLTIMKSATNGTLTLILDKTIKNIPSDEGYIMTVGQDRVEIISKRQDYFMVVNPWNNFLKMQEIIKSRSLPAKLLIIRCFPTGLSILMSSTTLII